ncbi:MAG: MerC mercury resistance protein [Cellvibrionales bacterium TMED49]|nr:MAG: MerC mercury resistance protein [Cellvibrionales bacterium TMED49]|tara:strand:+ start:285 stop:686 length:402 start_codon:yes stop_codon:yes gene_type:complete
MKNVQAVSDKLAITLSMTCIAHCFLTPSLAILAYGFLPFSIDNELIHKGILLVAVPISLFALTKGYTSHKTISVVPIALVGLGLLTIAVILGEDILGEFGEKGLTLMGSLLVAGAHYKNYRICKASQCLCHEE